MDRKQGRTRDDEPEGGPCPYCGLPVVVDVANLKAFPPAAHLRAVSARGDCRGAWDDSGALGFLGCCRDRGHDDDGGQRKGAHEGVCFFKVSSADAAGGPAAS